MPITFYLEADSFTELRAKAILALDIQTLDRKQAEAHVAKLQDELVDPVSETTEADVSDDENEISPEVIEHATALDAEKPKVKRTRKTKEKPAATTVVADFAKEVEAAADAEDLTQPAKLSLESVRTAFDAYVQKFGVSAAQIDGPVLLGRVFGPQIARIKDVPEDDQNKLGRIVAAVEGAILTNEFKREMVQ